MLVQSIIEVVIVAALIVGLFKEKKIAAFERRVAATIKNGRDKPDRI